MHLSPQQILIIAVIAAVGCGLMAGLFFAFSNFVMKALLHQPTESGVRTMQSISAFIQNPIFFVLFFGTNLAAAILAVTAVFRSLNLALSCSWPGPRFVWWARLR
ncbi:MAG: hypothetical protein IPF71_00350 [Rhodoferax sp.]|nr:hypothetical protein [Rhodoferax sp.]